MKKQNERRILANIGWDAERYFMLLQFILIMTTMIYLLYVIFITVKGASADLTDEQLSIIAPFLDRIDFLLLIRISILFCFVFLINILLGLFFLHRLTGPLVRIRTVLNQIAGGEVPASEVVLRKKDFPNDLAEALTNAIKKIRFWQKVK